MSYIFESSEIEMGKIKNFVQNFLKSNSREIIFFQIENVKNWKN